MKAKVLKKYRNQLLKEFNDNARYSVEDLFRVFRVHVGQKKVIIHLYDEVDNFVSYICVLNVKGKNDDFNIHDNEFENLEKALECYKNLVAENP